MCFLFGLPKLRGYKLIKVSSHFCLTLYIWVSIVAACTRQTLSGKYITTIIIRCQIKTAGSVLGVVSESKSAVNHLISSASSIVAKSSHGGKTIKFLYDYKHYNCCAFTDCTLSLICYGFISIKMPVQEQLCYKQFYVRV